MKLATCRPQLHSLTLARASLRRLLQWNVADQSQNTSLGFSGAHSPLDLAVAAKTDAFLAEVPDSVPAATKASVVSETLLYWRYLRAVAAGIDWLATAAKEDSVDKVAIGDVALAQSGLEFLTGLGLRPCLSPGVGPTLSDRLASGSAGADLLRVRPPSDASERLSRLAWLAETLGRWSDAGGDGGAVAVAAARFLPDRLAALLQLAFGPESLAAGDDGKAARAEARRRLHSLLGGLPNATAMRELLCLQRRAALPNSNAKWLVRAASRLLSEQLLRRPDGVLGLLGAAFDDAAAAGAGDSRHSVSEKVTSVAGLLASCPAESTDSLAEQLFELYARLGQADKRLQTACCHVIVCWSGGAKALSRTALNRLIRGRVLADFDCLCPVGRGSKDDAINTGVTKDDVTKDDVTKDDVTKDDVTKDDVTKDDVTKDDVTKDDVTKDDVTKESCTKDNVANEAINVVNLTEPLNRLCILLSCVKETDVDFLQGLAGLIDPLFYLLVTASIEQQQQKKKQIGNHLDQICSRLKYSLSTFTSVYSTELGASLLRRLLSDQLNCGYLPAVEFAAPDTVLVQPRRVRLPDAADEAGLRLATADAVLAMLDASGRSARPGLSGRLFAQLLGDLASASSPSPKRSGETASLAGLSCLVRLCADPQRSERVFSSAEPDALVDLCRQLLRHAMSPSPASVESSDASTTVDRRGESLELALSIVSAVTLGLHSANSGAFQLATLTQPLMEAAGRADLLSEASRRLARSLAIRTATLGRIDGDANCPTSPASELLSGSAVLTQCVEEQPDAAAATASAAADEGNEDEGEAAAAVYRTAFSDIQSGDPPRMGAGLVALTRQLGLRAPRGPRLIDACARLLQMCSDHPDSYVHLAAAEALAVLSCQLPARLLPLLASLYGPGGVGGVDASKGGQTRTRSVELRLRIGESMVRCSRYLNELLPHHASRIVGVLLVGARDPEPQLRASSLSCLAELCAKQRWWCLDRPSIGLQEILSCACSLLRSDPDPLPRRASAHLLGHLVRGCDRLSLASLPAACLTELHRALRLAAAAERDQSVLEYVQLALEELDSCVRDALFPSVSGTAPMRKRIWVLDSPSD